MPFGRTSRDVEMDTATAIPNIIHSEVASLGQPSSLIIGTISALLVFAALASMFLIGEDVFNSLRAASGKLRSLKLDSESLIISVSLLSILSITAAALLFERAKGLFLVLLLTSFAVSDALISGISEGSLLIRYLFMIILITVGICSFNSVQKRGLSSIQWLGLIYLLWQLIGLLVNGYGTTSLLLLPVQLGIFVGILIGLSNDYARKIDHLQFCHILGAIGIGLTAFHATALILAPQPFLAGRFKSYYLLPTNFANGYAPLLVAILWLAMHEKGRFVNTLAWATLPIGLGLLILSGTRNSILIVFVAVIVFSVIWPKKIMVLVVVGALLTIPLLVLLVNDTSQINGIFKRFSKLEASNRHDVWALAWNYIMQRPLLGYGIGKGGEVLGQTLQSWEKAEYINTHNAYLGVWLQHGIIGLTLVGMIILSGLIKGSRMLFSRNVHSDYKKVVILPVALLAGLATGGMFEEYLTSRGSVQQILWGFSLLMISTATKSFSFTSIQPEDSKILPRAGSLKYALFGR